MPPMPEATASPGVTKSAPAQKFLPSACSTVARNSPSASIASRASARSRISSTETWLLGGRSMVTTAT